MDPVLLGAVVAGAGGIIAYLLRENARLKRENWQYLQAMLGNTEVLEKFAEMRNQGGPPQ